MTYSALRLPSFTVSYVNSGSINVTQSISVTNGTNQLFDWVSINSACVYPGEAYYRSGSGNFQLASTVTDESAEVIGVVESVIPCANSSSLAKLVYYGKLTFDSSSLSLVDGAPYFLATSSINSFYKTGSNPFRNLTTSEPLVSKPIFIAISNYEAVLVNYRGHVNNAPFTQSFISPQSEWDCNCTDVEPLPDIVDPYLDSFIGTEPPTF